MYPVRILSIDGGGIRGIIPLKILEYIEKETKKPIHQLFNVIGGTSTGGIIALGLNSFKPKTNEVYKAHELMNFYTNDAKKLFSYRWESFGGWLLSSYRARNIENYLKNKFGDTTLLTQLPTTAQDRIVIVYSYDLTNNEPFEFCNDPKIGNDGLVWQAARSTSAAPTFFPAFEFKDPNETDENKPRVLIDGGVFINNPALNLLLEARRKYSQYKQQEQLLVSIGTGDFNPYKEHFKWSGKLGWAGSIFGVTSMATSSETDGQVTELLEYFDPRPGYNEEELEQWTKKRYYRFQKPFEKDVPMDGISRKQIKHLEQLGDELVKDKQGELDELCAILSQPIESDL